VILDKGLDTLLVTSLVWEDVPSEHRRIRGYNRENVGAAFALNLKPLGPDLSNTNIRYRCEWEIKRLESLLTYLSKSRFEHWTVFS